MVIGVEKIGDIAAREIGKLPGQKSISQAQSDEEQTKSNFVFGYPGKCPECGEIYVLKEFCGISAWVPTCDCLKKKSEKERQIWREQLKQKLKTKRINDLFEQSKLGARFSECTFENWMKRDELQHAYEAAVAYVVNWEKHLKNGNGLLFFGSVGTGKSHLAAAIVNALIQCGVTAIFQSTPDLLRRFRATYDEESKIKESVLMEALVEVDLLVLDDIGAEKWTEYSEAQLYQIIDMRYRWKKPIIITTNLRITEDPKLEDCIGPRAMDRLIEMCDLVELKGTSYRKLQAVKKNKNA